MRAPGPAGKFPLGKLDRNDKGELVVNLSIVGGKIRIDFGTKIAWFAMTADQAIELAHMISQRAHALKCGA